MYEEVDIRLDKQHIMRSVLNERVNMFIRTAVLEIGGVKDTHLDAELAEHTGRYKASKDMLFLLGGGNFVDDYLEFEINNITKAVKEVGLDRKDGKWIFYDPPEDY